MSFVQAKCPICGGMLAVDDTKKAAVCQFCGNAFVVEEAVNNYITNNITNNTVNNHIGEGAVVNVYEQSKSVPVLLERVAQFLEDKDWDNANQYCEEILDMDPKNAQAYLGKLMAEMQVPKKAELVRHKNFERSVNYQRILKYGDQAMQDELNGYLSEANNKNRNQEKIRKYQESEKQYQHACKIWEEQVASIQRAYEEKVDAQLLAENEKRLADMESRYCATIDQLSNQLQTLKEEKSAAEASLEALGFFAFSEKKNIKQRIAELGVQIDDAQQQSIVTKQKLSKEKANLESWKKDRKKQLMSAMTSQCPLPPKPERLPIVLEDGTTVTAAQLQNECVKDLILDAMEPDIVYERNDIFEIANKFEKMSIQRVAAITNSMVEHGYLEKFAEAGVVYFKLR